MYYLLLFIIYLFIKNKLRETCVVSQYDMGEFAFIQFCIYRYHRKCLSWFRLNLNAQIQYPPTFSDCRANQYYDLT